MVPTIMYINDAIRITNRASIVLFFVVILAYISNIIELNKSGQESMDKNFNE